MRAAVAQSAATSRVAVARPALVARAPVPRRQQLGSRGDVSCNGLFGLGLPELAVITGVAVLVFGPSKLPELGKSLGKTVKSFQTAAKEFSDELKAATADEDPSKPKAPEDEKVKKTDA